MALAAPAESHNISSSTLSSDKWDSINDYTHKDQCTECTARLLFEDFGLSDYVWDGRGRDADTWLGRADKADNKRGTVPVVGAAMVFHREPWTSSPGHVVYVKDVKIENEQYLVWVWHCNWAPEDYDGVHPTYNNPYKEWINIEGAEFIYPRGMEPPELNTPQSLEQVKIKYTGKQFREDAGEQLDLFFESIGSPLAGSGQSFIDAAVDHDLNKMGLWVGMMQYESHYCKDYLPGNKYPSYLKYNNCSGIKRWEIVNGERTRFHKGYADYGEYAQDYARIFTRTEINGKPIVPYDELSDEDIAVRWVRGSGEFKGLENWLNTARAQAEIINPLIYG